MSTRWEYEVVELPHSLWGTVDQKKLKEQFNILGRQGWELVGFNASATSGNPLGIFKRPSA